MRIPVLAAAVTVVVGCAVLSGCSSSTPVAVVTVTATATPRSSPTGSATTASATPTSSASPVTAAGVASTGESAEPQGPTPPPYSVSKLATDLTDRATRCAIVFGTAADVSQELIISRTVLVLTPTTDRDTFGCDYTAPGGSPGIGLQAYPATSGEHDGVGGDGGDDNMTYTDHGVTVRVSTYQMNNNPVNTQNGLAVLQRAAALLTR